MYSPTQTTTWLADPLAWWLRYHERWHPRLLGKPAIARVIGAGVAAGAAVWYRVQDRVGAIEAAHKAVGEEIRDLKALGHTIAPTVQDLADRAPLLAERGVVKVAGLELPDRWAINDIERTLPDHGRCRIDLGLGTPHGPTVLDAKCALTSDDYRTYQAKLEYEASWQLLHYAWAYGEVIGEPVTQYGVLYIPLEPKSRPPELMVWAVDPELLVLWHKSARDVWNRMDGQEVWGGVDWSSFRWFGRYGKEWHADAVLRHKLDPTLMIRDYVQHPRKEPHANQIQP